MKKTLLIFLFLFVHKVNAGNELNPSPELLKKGKEVYMTNCTACHGAKGDGRGPAAVAIQGPAKPRDFTSGFFKFGEKPADVFKTITNGSPGTAMPGWNSLPESDRWALAYYVKSLKVGK